MKTVAEIMTKPVVRAKMNDSLREVQRLFEVHGFHHLLVFEGRELMGVVSDRDLLRYVSPFVKKAAERLQDIQTLNRSAHQIMTRKPIVVPGAARVGDAARLMLRAGVSCLPVTDEEGKIAGIVTSKDIMRELVEMCRQAAA